MKISCAMLLLLAAAPLSAQTNPTWDTSGNGMLTGTYYFRQVYYFLSGQYANGVLSDATVAYGNITFSGSGTYRINATVLDAYYGASPISTSGTYSIAASGYGFISNPVTGDSIYGLVNQQGIFIGSDTENQNGYNDLFVAAPIGSTPASTATFKGSYSVAFLDLSSGNPATSLNAMLQMNPDGAGNLGTVALTGYVGQSGSQKYTQSYTGVKYIFSNGAGVTTFPNSSNSFLYGQYYIYISPDGNFIFGGSPNDFDMFVGVRTGTATPSLGGLYYQAGIDEDESNLAAGYALLDTYYGALKAGGGSIVGHQRVVDLLTSGGPVDYTYADSYSTPANSAYGTTAMNYAIGANGVRVGSGVGPYLGLNVAIPQSPFSGSGVFLDPTGIVNAASSAPFTAGIAPGELLTLYGTNLAASLVVASDIPFPTTLGNVQVMVNGVAAPIYYVSPTQISAIVPYSIATAIAQVQVINDNVPSNSVSMWMNVTSPGIFTVPPGGLGYGAVLHQDGTLVTTQNPAAIGETVSVFATGLGAVSPTISDGAAGPSDTLSYTTNTIAADISGVTATVTYSGLAPGLAGLYQVNVTIPTGVTAGDNSLDLSGPDSYTGQVLIPVGSPAGSSAAARAGGPMRRPQTLRFRPGSQSKPLDDSLHVGRPH